MSKKMAHTILFFGDLFCFWGLWIGYHDLQRILMEITNQADMIRFSNRAGFFIIGVFILITHLIIVIEHFFPKFIKKNMSLFNWGSVVGLILFLSSGFYVSSLMRSKVENAGYIYCREASGISALAKSLVYTKDMAICEDLIEAK